MTLLSFHNDPAIKEKYLNRVRAHRLADEIVKGVYWESGKGCAVGCTIHSSDHGAYEEELGIPRILAKLEDCIFENLPKELAKGWPEKFLNSVPIGKDLSKIWIQFAIFILTDSTQCASRHSQCEIVATHLQEELNGKTVDWLPIREKAFIDRRYAAAAAAAYVDAYGAYAAANYANANANANANATYAAYVDAYGAYAAANYANANANANATYAAYAAAYAADAADAAYAATYAATYAAYAADAADAADAATYAADAATYAADAADAATYAADAATYAAYAATYAADAADAAVYAAYAATYAATYAADASAAKQKAFVAQSEKLLQLLRDS
jgi:hypothetical protein